MSARWSYPAQAVPSFAAPSAANVAAFPLLAGEIVQSLIMGSIDPAIAVIVLVACMSLLTQGVADIAWPNGMSSPIGVSGFLTAPSGGGKSVVMRLLIEPIRKTLTELCQREEIRKAKPLFFIEDATREAILMHLSEWLVAALFTDEGGQLSQLLKHGGPTLAKLVNGEPLHHARVSRGRMALEGHRLTMMLAEQPGVFERDKQLMGACKGGVGLINRFMVAAATGSPNASAALNLGLPTAIRARYEERIHALLEQTIEGVRTQSARPVLRLDAAAKHRLLTIADEAMALRNDPRFAVANEYTTRHTERVLRLAGALHVFHHGPTGEVDLESVAAAHQIGMRSLDSFVAMMAVPAKPTQVEVDAARIGDALNRSAPMNGPYFPLALLRRLCTNVGLTKPRFDKALPLLAESGHVFVFADGHQDWVRVNQPFLPHMSPVSPIGFTPPH